MSCWNCGAADPVRPFCPACGKVAVRRREQTHFDTFGLTVTLSPDVKALEQTYRDLSLVLHPDRLGTASPQERRLSAEQSVALNEGLKILRDPIRRAFYVLALEGVDLEREDGAHRTAIDTAFLEDILERREALSDAREAGDLAAAQAQARDIQRVRDEALREAEDALTVRRADPSSAAALTTATGALARVRYYVRFLEEVAAMEEESLS